MKETIRAAQRRSVFEGEENALRRYNFGSGAGWKSKIERKRGRGNQTSGKTKVLTCQATALQRYMAKTSRSYKHRDFRAWSEKVRNDNS